jgi:hypothetical protein
MRVGRTVKRIQHLLVRPILSVLAKDWPPASSHATEDVCAAPLRVAKHGHAKNGADRPRHEVTAARVLRARGPVHPAAPPCVGRSYPERTEKCRKFRVERSNRPRVSAWLGPASANGVGEPGGVCPPLSCSQFATPPPSDWDPAVSQASAGAHGRYQQRALAKGWCAKTFRSPRRTFVGGSKKRPAEAGPYSSPRIDRQLRTEGCLDIVNGRGGALSQEVTRTSR